MVRPLEVGSGARIARAVRALRVFSFAKSAFVRAAHFREPRFKPESRTQKKDQPLLVGLLKLVAGLGFEPRTFRL